MKIQQHKDIQEIVDRAYFLQDLDKKTIFITGATGLIGTALIQSILLYNAQNKTNIQILALVRDLSTAKQRLGQDKNLVFVLGSMESLPAIAQKIDYIVHAASSTSSQDFVHQPVDVLTKGLQGTINILELARDQKVEKIVFLSSIEVYGQCQQFEVSESDIGIIDWTSVRSSYVEVKRVSETLLRSYFFQHHVPALSARLTPIFGAGFGDTDNRVYAQFVRAVQADEDIILKTKGETIRNYCYLTDAIVGLLILLHRGQAGEIYNLANEDTTCSILEMAELVIKTSGAQSKIVFDIHEDPTKLGYYPTIKIKLVSDKLRQLGWKPEVSLVQAFSRMLND